MIGRANRFHGYGSLRYVYQRGKTVRGSLLNLRYCPNDKRKDYRLAVVVSKKVNKSAVARNRIRRRIYEACRVLIEADQAYDLVITVFQPNVETMPVPELNAQIRQILSQAELKITE